MSGTLIKQINHPAYTFIINPTSFPCRRPVHMNLNELVKQQNKNTRSNQTKIIIILTTFYYCVIVKA